MRLNPASTLGLAAALVALGVLAPMTAAAIFQPPPNGVPEIGANAIGGAIAIVAGGLAVLRDRMRRG